MCLQSSALVLPTTFSAKYCSAKLNASSVLYIEQSKAWDGFSQYFKNKYSQYTNFKENSLTNNFRGINPLRGGTPSGGLTTSGGGNASGNGSY